jgi:hypothetical protein
MSSLLSEFPEDMDELLDEIEAEWDQAFAGLGDECHYPFSELEFGIDFPDFLPPPDGNMLGDTRVSGNSSNIFLNWSAGIDKVDTSMRVELPSVVCGDEQNMPEVRWCLVQYLNNPTFDVISKQVYEMEKEVGCCHCSLNRLYCTSGSFHCCGRRLRQPWRPASWDYRPFL